MESPVGPARVDTSYKFKLRPRERNKKHNELTSKAFASPPPVPRQTHPQTGARRRRHINIKRWESAGAENLPTVLEPEPEPSKRYQIHIIRSPCFPPPGLARSLLPRRGANKSRGREEKTSPTRLPHSSRLSCPRKVPLFPSVIVRN